MRGEMRGEMREECGSVGVMVVPGVSCIPISSGQRVMSAKKIVLPMSRVPCREASLGSRDLGEEVAW
jgi:hypothetical protein